MANVPITADSAVFHYDFGYPLRATTQFQIQISYIGSTADPYRVWPELSINDGASFTPIINSVFTLNQGLQKFSIRVHVNNDPTIKQDYRVNLKVKPVNNLSYFTNPDGMDTSIEFTNAGVVSVVTLDEVTTNSVDEGQHGVAHFVLTPATSFPTTIQVNVLPAEFLGVQIDTLEFSIDNINWVALPVSRQAIVPAHTSDIYIRFAAVLDNIMLETDTVGIQINEVIGDRAYLFGLPLTRTFTIVDKTILPEGTFINWYCDGYKKTGRYSDGLGGFTTNVIQNDSPDCGFTYAPVGTVLSTYCANKNFYEKVADGIGGYTIRLKTANVAGLPPGGCSYVAPTANAQTDLTPTTLQAFGVAIVSNSNLGFASLKRDGAKSNFGALWGKWYWEVKVSRPTTNYQPIGIGVATATHDMGSWIGSDNKSWAWWPYDQTKYYNDHQDSFPATVNDQDVISVLLDMDNHTLKIWLNGQDLGVLYNNLADEKLYAVVNAKDDSYALFNFGQYAFVYNPPSGYHPGFGQVPNPPPDRGTILSTYCVGYDKKQDIADGKYGYTTNTIATNSTDCGYNPIPAQGTILGYYCTGTTRYKRVADGAGGETQVVAEINSTACGYVPPPVPALTPTNLNPDWKNTNTVLSNNNLTAVMNGAVRAVKSVYSGKWYWEVVADTLEVIVGVGTTSTTNTTNTIIGSNNITWGFNLSNNSLVYNGTSIATTYQVQVNDVIGLGLDFVNQRLSFSINGVWQEDLVFNNLPIVDYYPMISSLALAPTILPQATIHFGNNDLVYTEPSGYVPGLGATTTVYQRKGTVYSYYCSGTTYYVRKYDGGGGLYDEVYQVNSTTCGWRPPDPAGTLKSTYCVGYDQWGKYADGNYGLYDQLIETSSTNCGYKAFGTLISTRCEGYTRIGTYSDGEIPQGTYDQLIAENSPDCGYSNGSSGNSPGSSNLDPNLPISIPEGIVIGTYPVPVNDELLIINEELPNP